ncbi:MAG: ATP-binding protein, partial [Gemmatimonadaceae bacterium]
ALVTGETIDAAKLAALGRDFDGQLLVRTPRAVLVSTVPPGEPANGRDFVTTTLPLGLTAAGEPALLELRYPMLPVRKALTATLVANFVLWGGAAVLLGGLGTGLVSRRVLQPLQRIVEVMRLGASTGVRERQLDTADAAKEVRSLAESYAALMDSLDAERRALEQRGSELAAANAGLRQEIEERERVELALRERDEQLRRSQKLEAIGTLAGGVAHDFNNLLSVISGFTELAIAQAEDGEPVVEELRQVIGASQRAALLTRQLLAFGRKQVLQPRVLDLHDVVAGVEPMLRRLIGAHIAITTQTERGLASIYADPGQLEQVVVNLVVNARDAMPAGGTLVISCENGLDGEQRIVKLIVRDTGTGMSEGTKSRVFEPFFTTKDPGKGTGLGLATVYGIVVQSGGRIDIDSTLGVGTTITISFPATGCAAPASVETPVEETVRGGTETILLVEDEPALRQLAERALADAGYTVLSAESGESALAHARSHPGEIHLVVTDIVMPGMSGPVLVARLAAVRPAARILYVSGYADDTIANYRLDSSTAFLAKPFVPTTLLRKIRETLDARTIVRQTMGAK